MLRPRIRNSRKKSSSEVILENTSRRNFLKFVAFGGAALALTAASKKINGIVKATTSTQAKSSNKIKISEGLSFVEDTKEFTFFDKAGNELLIFEKGA